MPCIIYQKPPLFADFVVVLVTFVVVVLAPSLVTFVAVSVLFCTKLKVRNTEFN